MKKTTNTAGREYWVFWCPGCDDHHSFTTKAAKGPVWMVSGPEESPTFAPSLLVRYGSSQGDRRCHLYLRKGMVQYLGDCTHSYKNKTIPVQDPQY